MIRRGEFTSMALAVAVAGMLLVATPHIASAQDAPKPAAQEDILKFSTAAPTLILFQIHADKAADFEAGWASIRSSFAKVTDATDKAFGETLGKMYKLDQPPMETPAGKAVIYVLQVEAPSTTHSYNPGSIVYTVLWKNGAEGAPLKREEADEIFNKLKPVFQSITPWKLNKIG